MRLFCLLWLTVLAGMAAPELRGQSTGFKYLEVTVVDPDGKPMADVPVEISIDEMKIPLTTDAEGLVGTNIPADKNYEIEVRVKHEGYTAMGVGWRGEKVPERVMIPLTKGVTFGGIVHDDQGQPVEGVEISGGMVWKNRYELVKDGEVVPYLGDELATTDEQGKWSCSFAPEGKLKVHLVFMHPDYFIGEVDAPEWSELKEHKLTTILEKGAALTGVVLDPVGNPVPDAMVELVSHYDAQRWGTQVLSNALGKFRMPCIPHGKASLSVVADRFAPLLREIDEVSSHLLTLQLTKGQSIQIKVVNHAGEPLPNARVVITDWHYPGNELDLDDNYLANEQGIWRWENAPNAELTYRISAQGYRESRQQLKGGEEMQTISLETGTIVKGKVIDRATREPITKFELRGVAVMDYGRDEEVLRIFGGIQLLNRADYRFQTGVMCKRFHISCTADGYKSSNSRSIKPDEGEVAWDFELEREEKGK
jgi:hypothetical protein